MSAAPATALTGLLLATIIKQASSCARCFWNQLLAAAVAGLDGHSTTTTTTMCQYHWYSCTSTPAHHSVTAATPSTRWLACADQTASSSCATLRAFVLLFLFSCAEGPTESRPRLIDRWRLMSVLCLVFCVCVLCLCLCLCVASKACGSCSPSLAAAWHCCHDSAVLRDESLVASLLVVSSTPACVLGQMHAPQPRLTKNNPDVGKQPRPKIKF
jgi:hypothetical protein